MWLDGGIGGGRRKGWMSIEDRDNRPLRVLSVWLDHAVLFH